MGRVVNERHPRRRVKHLSERPAWEAVGLKAGFICTLECHHKVFRLVRRKVCHCEFCPKVKTRSRRAWERRYQ